MIGDVATPVKSAPLIAFHAILNRAGYSTISCDRSHRPGYFYRGTSMILCVPCKAWGSDQADSPIVKIETFE